MPKPTSSSSKKASLLRPRTLVVALLIIVGALFVINEIRTNIVASRNPVAGSIEIKFNDGVTVNQAADLLRRENIKDLNDEELRYYDIFFTPNDYRAIKTSQFDIVKNKLSNYAEVTSFADATNDGSSRANPDETWVKISFRQDVNIERLIEILEASGLGLGANPENPLRLDRTMIVQADSIQQKTYIKKLKKSALVQSATWSESGGLCAGTSSDPQGCE